MSATTETSTVTTANFMKPTRFPNEIVLGFLAHCDHMDALTRQQLLVNFARSSRGCESLAQDELRKTLVLTEDRFSKLCQDLSDARKSNRKREELMKELDQFRHVVVTHRMSKLLMQKADEDLVELSNLDGSSTPGKSAVFKELQRVTFASSVRDPPTTSASTNILERPSTHSTDTTVDIFPTALENHALSVCSWRPWHDYFPNMNMKDADSEHNFRHLTLHMTLEDLVYGWADFIQPVEDGASSRRIIASRAKTLPACSIENLNNSMDNLILHLSGLSTVEMVDPHLVFDQGDEEISGRLPSWSVFLHKLESSGLTDRFSLSYTEDKHTKHCQACGPWTSSMEKSWEVAENSRVEESSQLMG